MLGESLISDLRLFRPLRLWWQKALKSGWPQMPSEPFFVSRVACRRAFPVALRRVWRGGRRGGLPSRRLRFNSWCCALSCWSGAPAPPLGRDLPRPRRLLWQASAFASHSTWRPDQEEEAQRGGLNCGRRDGESPRRWGYGCHRPRICSDGLALPSSTAPGGEINKRKQEVAQ